jgi:hypothetical protein
MVDSSELSFNLIPIHFRPTTLQILVPHVPIVDYVIWPQMRDNFIKYGMKYCRPEVFELLSSSYRIRGTLALKFDLDVLNGDASPIPAFIERLSTVDGWVLLDKFWTAYPELVEGLEPRKFLILETDLI